MDWKVIIASSDPETIWSALYALVRDNSLREPNIYRPAEDLGLDEFSSDITQEVFLRLLCGDRLSHFLANNYTSDQIESELILNELAAALLSRTARPIGQENSNCQMSPSCENLAFTVAPRAKTA